MATAIWVNIGSGNGLLRHQAITWTNVDLSSSRSSDIHLRASSQEIPQPSITEIICKINDLKFYSNFPGADELTQKHKRGHISRCITKKTSKLPADHMLNGSSGISSSLRTMQLQRRVFNSLQTHALPNSEQKFYCQTTQEPQYLAVISNVLFSTLNRHPITWLLGWAIRDLFY